MGTDNCIRKSPYWNIPKEKSSKGFLQNVTQSAKGGYDDMVDANADQRLINQGATIVRSEITLTDYNGRNRIIVRGTKSRYRTEH